jgi:single-stranded DNA-binding protein
VFNQITLVGRLVRDAATEQPPNGRAPQLRFTLAVDRLYEVDGETPTDFWPVVIHGEYGGRPAPHLTREPLVLVAGSVHPDTRRDPDGTPPVVAYVSDRVVRFLDHRTAGD